jgi:hypothetical protein
MPNSLCKGNTVEIFDHTGVSQTSKNAVFRVENPKTPNGPAPFLELYNPTLAVIEDCVDKVKRIRKPAPGSVVMNAREYQLSGSNQVVCLIEDCSGPRADTAWGLQQEQQDDPGLGEGGESSNPTRTYECGLPNRIMINGVVQGSRLSGPLPDYLADGTCDGPNGTCELKIAHFDSANSPVPQSGDLTYTMHGVKLVGQPSTFQQPLTLRLFHQWTDSFTNFELGIADWNNNSVVDCLGGLDDATTRREAHILVEDNGSGELRILDTPILFLEF